MRETIVSKDVALSSAISSLQSSMKHAQAQKMTDAVDKIRARLEDEAVSRAAELDRQHKVDLQREISAVKTEAEKAHWEERRQLMDEIAAAETAHNNAMQALRVQEHATVAALESQLAEAKRNHADELASVQATHATERQTMNLR